MENRQRKGNPKAYAEKIKKEFDFAIDAGQEMTRRIKRDTYGQPSEQAQKLTKAEALDIIEWAARHCADVMRLDGESGKATAEELKAGKAKAEAIAESMKKYTEATAEDEKEAEK